MKSLPAVLLVPAVFALSACSLLPFGQPQPHAAATAAPEPPALVTPTAHALPTATAITIDPLLHQAWDAFAAGDAQAALALFNEAHAIEPNSPAALHGRGAAHVALGDRDEAIAAFDAALLADDAYAPAYLDRGRLLFEQSEFELALADINDAIQHDAANPSAYRLRAAVFDALRNPQAALIDLQLYLALLPQPDDMDEVVVMIDRLADQLLPFEAERDGRVFADNFADPESGEWERGGDRLALAFFDADGYRLQVPLANSAVWASNTVWLEDMRVEVDVRFVGGSENNLFGVLCRYADENNFYAMLISTDGYYGIARRVEGGPLEPVEGGQLQTTDAIVPGVNQVNHIEAGCVGDTLSLSVNGELEIELQDTAIDAGASGMIINTYSPRGSDMLFDNFEVYTP